MSADESTEKPILLRIAEHLERHGVEFMVQLEALKRLREEGKE